MGWMIAHGRCICCSKPFGFNPHKVPSSSAITGQREPVCRDCFEAINSKRIAAGLAPFALMPGAYEPTEDYGE